MPVGAREGAPGPDALAWLPLVGMIVGGIAGGAARFASPFVSHPLVVALVFGISIALTGALHVDGFLDTCDAVFAPAGRERRREILKDPRHGTFAIAAFAVVAVFWLAALEALPVESLEQTCALAAGGGRLATVIAAWERRPPLAVVALNGAIVLVLAFLVAPAAWIVVVGLAVLALALTAAMRRALGALTGDAYGCSIVVCEVAALLALTFAVRL